MMEELWWNRLVNSVRFLDDVQDVLREEKSVFLVFESEIPWKEVMIESLEQRLSDMTDSRTFNVLDVSKAEEPGDFLMERFCSKEERNKYWPITHGTPERFLAQNRATPLNNRYVCLMGVTSANAAKWAESVSEYMENCDPDRKHGIFILVVESASVISAKHTKQFKYADYVSDYDCMMLCLTLISDISCSRAEKMYLCEAASNIAQGQVELAGLLVSEKLKLIQNPISVAMRVFRENGIEDASLCDRVNKAIWEAQIKLVFPKLENFRAEKIRKYEAVFQSFLPIRSSNNDCIDHAADLEIGQLYYICKENRTSRILDTSEYEMLKKMRDARNTLAHWKPLTYDQLKDIRII